MHKTMVAAMVAAGVLAGVAGLAGCGGSSGSGGTATSGAPSSQTLLNDAQAALRSAQSVQISGTVTQSGKNVQMNAGLFRSGAVSGTFSGPFSGVQATFKLIVVGGKAYIYVDKQFLSAIAKVQSLPSDACSLLCGKYLEVPASQFSGLTLNGLTGAAFKGTNRAAPGVTVTTIDGQPAYRITDGHGAYLYIAENGTHYPLELTKSGTGVITFSEWNSVPPVTAPPSSQIVSSSGL